MSADSMNNSNAKNKQERFHYRLSQEQLDAEQRRFKEKSCKELNKVKTELWSIRAYGNVYRKHSFTTRHQGRSVSPVGKPGRDSVAFGTEIILSELMLKQNKLRLILRERSDASISSERSDRSRKTSGLDRKRSSAERLTIERLVEPLNKFIADGNRRKVYADRNITLIDAADSVIKPTDSDRLPAIEEVPDRNNVRSAIMKPDSGKSMPIP
jgi:hypothetical protein